MNTSCRFCGHQFSVSVPEEPAAAKMVKQLATKACCDRCADHHRGQRDIADVIQKAALMFRHGTSEEKPRAKECLDLLCKSFIDRAEKHYLISGFASEAHQLVANIIEKPDYAAYFARQTEAGIRAEAERLSAVQPEDPAYTY